MNLRSLAIYSVLIGVLACSSDKQKLPSVSTITSAQTATIAEALSAGALYFYPVGEANKAFDLQDLLSYTSEVYRKEVGIHFRKTEVLSENTFPELKPRDILLYFFTTEDARKAGLGNDVEKRIAGSFSLGYDITVDGEQILELFNNLGK